MRNLTDLNINDAGQPVNREPPSREIITAFELEFEVRLPAEYVSLLNYANGGHPELDSIAPIGRAGAARRSVDHFYYLNEDREGTDSLWLAANVWRSILGKEVLPIAQDGGGNPFVLDFGTTPAAVRACLHDEGFSVVDIAPSFVQFVDALEIDCEMI